MSIALLPGSPRGVPFDARPQWHFQRMPRWLARIIVRHFMYVVWSWVGGAAVSDRELLGQAVELLRDRWNPPASVCTDDDWKKRRTEFLAQSAIRELEKEK